MVKTFKLFALQASPYKGSKPWVNLDAFVFSSSRSTNSMPDGSRADCGDWTDCISTKFVSSEVSYRFAGGTGRHSKFESNFPQQPAGYNVL
jgi:hypothetical protein